MRRVLIVANQTLGGTALQQEISTRAKAEECDFWVLVPSTPRSHLAVPPTGGLASAVESTPLGASEPDDGAAFAEARLAAELQRLKDVGVKASGEIGDPDPLQAIQDTLAARQFDEIILATLPQGVSRWLRQDLVHRAQRKFHLPLTHVVSSV